MEIQGMSSLSKMTLAAVGVVTLAAIAALAAVIAWPNSAGAGPDEGAQVPAGEVERIAQGAGPEQRAALEDGQVTNSEYVNAVYATVACIRAAGIPVSDPSWSGGRLEYTGGPFPTYEELQAAKPTMQACYEQHLRGLDLVQAR